MNIDFHSKIFLLIKFIINLKEFNVNIVLYDLNLII